MIESTEEEAVSGKIAGIITAAQRVFGQYGFEKTSMRDIARELDFSKASLYYYFLDKESLFKAVIQKEQKEFLRLLTEIINKPMQASGQLREYILLRHNFFNIFLNLSKLRSNESIIQKPFMRKLIGDLKKQEYFLVTQIFKKGADDGEFVNMDHSRMSLLFMDIVKGLRLVFIHQAEKEVSGENPDQQVLDHLKDFTEIFIKGIKRQ